MGRPRKLSSTERREAVLSLLRGEETAEAIGRRLGIDKSTVSRWREEFLAGGEAALTDGKADPRDRQIAELEQQIADRDQVIGEYTVANRILKKLSDMSASKRNNAK